ncbi:hypothetical protein ACFQ3Z_27565 [Streptomyces nogalater]
MQQQAADGRCVGAALLGGEVDTAVIGADVVRVPGIVRLAAARTDVRRQGRGRRWRGCGLRGLWVRRVGRGRRIRRIRRMGRRRLRRGWMGGPGGGCCG